MAYADYDFYLNEYLGDAITGEDFPRLSQRASDYILLDESIMTASAFSGEQAVSSETVGGWSRSYRAPSVSSAEVSYLAGRKREALLLYLGELPAFAGIFKVRSYPCPHRRG